MPRPCPFCNRYTEPTAPCVKCGHLASDHDLPRHLRYLAEKPPSPHPQPGSRPTNYREFSP